MLYYHKTGVKSSLVILPKGYILGYTGGELIEYVARILAGAGRFGPAKNGDRP